VLGDREHCCDRDDTPQRSNQQTAQKKKPALAHGALSPTAMGFQRLAASRVFNLRLKIKNATPPR
jgi:hypothetical protein